MSRKKEIIKQAGIYSVSSQIKQFITLIAAIVSRHFLGPVQMGIWATLQIVVDYSKYAALGSLYSVSKEIPYYEGKGESETGNEIKNIVFTIVLCNTTLIAVGLVIFALFTKGSIPVEITYGLFIVAAIVILQRMSDLLINLLRSYKKFTLASKQLIYSAIANAALVAGLTYAFKIYGFVWAILLSLVFNIAYIQIKNRFHFKLRWNRERIKEILRFGLPLMAVGVVTTFYRTMDKVLIIKFLGFEAAGFYSIALLTASFVYSFFNSIAVVLFPHFQEKFSETDDPKHLKGFMRNIAFGYAVTTPIFIAAAWFIAPFFVQWLLPKFAPGIEAMKYLSLSILFLALAQPFSDLLVTIKKHIVLMPILLATAGGAFFFGYVAIKQGTGIEGVAVAMTVAAFINFTFTFVMASRHVGDRKENVTGYLSLLSLFLYLAGTLVGLEALGRVVGGGVLSICLQSGLFCVAYAPLWIFFERRFGVFDVLKEKFLTKKVAIS